MCKCVPREHRKQRILSFQVNVSLNLRNIFEVNEKSQYISLETSFRMWWRDERITGVPLGGEEFVRVNGKAIDNFWIPDVFIDQAKALRSPTFHVKPTSIRVYPDGVIRYSFVFYFQLP